MFPHLLCSLVLQASATVDEPLSFTIEPARSPAFSAMLRVADDAQDDGFEMRMVARAAIEGFDGWSFDSTLGGKLFQRADLDEGDVSLARIGVRFEALHPLGRWRDLGLELRVEQSGYDFSDSSTIDGVDEVWLFSLGSSLTTRMRDDWSWTLHLNASAGAEDSADWSQSLTVGGGASATLPMTKDWSLTAGGFASSRLEDDPLFYPWVQLDWQPNDQVRLGDSGDGYGLDVSWVEGISTYVNLSFVERQYRMDGYEVDEVDFSDGAFRDSEFAVNAGAVFQWNSRLKLEFFGGAAIRELTLLDDGESEVFQDTTRPTTYFGLALRYGF